MTGKINKIVKTLMISDFFLNCGWGLLSPIFAIFVVENIASGSALEAAKIAGFASLFYWGTKSLLQIPIGHYLDKNHGEKDDFWFMFLGTFLTGLAPLGYLLAYLPWHIYVLQVIHAIGMSMALPSWLAIFTRHIDKGREAFEWGLESTSIGLGAGIAGGLGGILAANIGFNWVFILTGFFTIISAILLIVIRKNISPRNEQSLRFSPLKSPLEEVG
jgi:MFS family permease